MNYKKVKLQKAVGIINLIFGIILALGGLVFMFWSRWIVELIKSSVDPSQTDFVDSIFTSVVIIAGVILIAVSVVMIVFSVKLLKSPQIKADGRINERNGIVIFFVVIDLLSVLSSLYDMFMGEFDFTTIIVMAAYLAAAIVGIISLKEAHHLPENANYSQYRQNASEISTPRQNPLSRTRKNPTILLTRTKPTTIIVKKLLKRKPSTRRLFSHNPAQPAAQQTA